MGPWDEKETKRLFQILPFYNVLTEKPKIKGLKNIDLLHELPFYDEVKIYEMSKAFRWYARSYKAYNISIYCPLSGSTYIKLSRKLKNSMKGLINIKNNDNKCFLWCHIRHLNPLKIHPERKTNDFDYKRIELV